MSKKEAWGTKRGKAILTRRDALAYGAVAATSLYLPGGLIGSARAQAASFAYYIGPDGSDNNPGTLSQPWAITAINTKRSTYAGKTVGVLDGTYDLVRIMGQPGGNFESGVLKIAAGSAGSPTVIKAVNARQAIIDWNRAAQTNSSEGSTFQPYGDYVTIDGLVIANNNYRAVCNYSQGGNYFTVRNCLFRGQSFAKGSGGGKNSCIIYTQGHSDILIQNCRFIGGSAPVDSNRHSQVQSYTNTTRLTIEYCTFIGEADTGILLHLKENPNPTPMVRFCYFKSVNSSNLTNFGINKSSTTDRATFHHNIFVTGGGPIFWADDYGGMAGVFDIYNNDFIGNWDSRGAWAKFETDSPAQMNIYNNIWWRQSGGGGSYGDMNVASASKLGNVDRNYYPSSNLKILVNGSTTYSTLAAWRSATGKDANSIVGSNPLFSLAGTDAAQYQLLGNSPCKTLGEGGAEIGAWGGASQVGCSFGGGVVLQAPKAPELSVT